MWIWVQSRKNGCDILFVLHWMQSSTPLNPFISTLFSKDSGSNLVSFRIVCRFSVLSIPYSQIEQNKSISHTVFCTVSIFPSVWPRLFRYNAEKAEVHINFAHSMHVFIHFSQIVCRLDGRRLLCCFHLSHLAYFVLREVFCLRKIYPFIHRGIHCTIYSIILDPAISIDSLLFWATEKQAIHRGGRYLQVIFYQATCCLYDAIPPLIVATTHFQLITICPCMQRLILRTLYTGWISTCPYGSRELYYGYVKLLSHHSFQKDPDSWQTQTSVPSLKQLHSSDLKSMNDSPLCSSLSMCHCF